MNRFLFVPLVVAIALGAHGLFGDCKFQEAKSPDGKIQLLLENEYLKLKLEPDLGGQCTGITVKSGGTEIEDFKVNLFDDMDWNKIYFDQSFSKKTYQYKVLENSAKLIKILLEARGSGEYSYIYMRKTVEMKAGECLFTVGYELHNVYESMGSFNFRLWCHNGLYPKSLKANYYWSSPQGVTKTEFPASRDQWEYQPARGWTGIVNNPPSSGLACIVDYPKLLAFYDWFGNDCANMEWRYAPVRIKNGESFRTAVTVLPFSGLKGLDHANRYAAFRFNIPEDLKPRQQPQLSLDIAAGMAKEIKLALDYRNTASADWIRIISKDLKTAPDGIQSIEFSVPALPEGRYVLKATLKTDIGDDSFERIFTVGSAADKGEYVYKPVEQRSEGAKSKDYFPYKVSEEVVTPHVEWFKPYSGGKPKVLFIQHFRHVRTIVELAQRLSIDYDVPTIMEKGYCFSGIVPPVSEETGENIDSKPYYEALEQIICGDKRYDVIVYGCSVPWKELTMKTKAALVERLKNGTALIADENTLKSQDLAELFSKGEPFPTIKEAWREWQSLVWKDEGDSLEGNGEKGGRIIKCPIRNSAIFFTHEFCRALLWAAKMEPRTILEFPSKESSFDRETLHANGMPLKVVSPSGGHVTVETVFTDGTLASDDHTAWSGTQEFDLKPGENLLTLAIPALTVGHYTVGAIVKDGSGVLNSSVRKIELTDPLKIDKIVAGKAVCKSNEPVTGAIEVSNSGTGDSELECAIEFSDNWGRIIAASSSRFKLEPGKRESIPFSFLQSNPLSVIHKVEAKLLKGKSVVATKRLEVTFPEQAYKDDDYLAFTWPGSDGSIWGGWEKYGSPILRDYCGFNLEMSGNGAKSTERNCKYYRFGLLGDAYNDWQTCKDRGVRKFCFNDPSVVKKFTEDAEKWAEEGARYGWFALNVGDEVSLTHWESPSEICFCPLCKNGFAQWIKSKYTNLETLNSEWATEFKDWSQVEPMIESEAKDRPNFAPWSDYRVFMEDSYADFFMKMRKASVDKTPGARFSVCGVQPGHPYSGYDWWKLRDVFEFVMPYFSTAALRSFNDHGKYGKYTGYRISPEQQTKDSWSFFFEGQFVFSYFLGEYPLLPDYTISHTYADPVKENSDRFERGIGKLFIKTARQGDGIAIHCSQPSIHVNYMLKYREKAAPDFLRTYRSEVSSLESVLKDLGYDPSYISNEEIESGKLTPGKIRMLVLPLSTAISAKEAEAIRSYVEAGGIVLADCLIGLYNEHGKPYGKGCLDDLFGIERSQPASDRLSYQPCKFDGSTKEMVFVLESGVSQKDSKPILSMGSTMESKVAGFTLSEPARGGSAAFLKESGKGRAIYLSFLSEYSKNPASASDIAPLFKQILQAAGLPEPEVKVKSADAQPALCQVLRHKFGDGKSLFLGFMVRDGLVADGKTCKVEFPGEFHVYDLLKGGLVKKGTSFEITPIPGIGSLYAALPYSVEGLELSCQEKVVPGTSLPYNLKILSSDGKVEYHVIRLEILNPDGKEEKCYTANLEAQNGVCKGSLDIALNAPPGKWTLKARDILTGTETQKVFEVGR